MASSESNTNVSSAQTSSSETSGTFVNDIVHGIIELPEYIRIIIDTEQFQRLRYISQLGVAKFVYPTAGYCRFEHSIGTFHLASKLVKQIKKQLIQEKSEISVTDEDVKCVEIAALCHDLGHGPYSHFWEQAFDERIPSRKHEVLSVEIFEELIKNEISGKTIRDRIGLSDEHIELIGGIISGKMDPKEDKDTDKYKDKLFLIEIIANKKSGLDVDKFDYLCRDSIYLGWSNKNKIHDVKRIMRFLRVAKDQNNEWHLAMRDREIFHIHDVFYYRHLLHRYGYQHKTVKAVECLFKQAIKIIVDNQEYRYEFIENVLRNTNFDEDDVNIWFSTNFISKVCDHHLWEMMKKYASDIVSKIQERNMIKLYCQIQVLHKDTDQAKYLESVKKLEEIPDYVSEHLMKTLKEIKEINGLDSSFELVIGNLRSLHKNSTLINDLNEQLNKSSEYSNTNSTLAENLIEKLEQLSEDSNENNKIKIINEKINSLRKSLEESEKLIKKIYEIIGVDNSTRKLVKHFIDHLNKFYNISENISISTEGSGTHSISTKELCDNLNKFNDILDTHSRSTKDLIKRLNKLRDISTPAEYLKAKLEEICDISENISHSNKPDNSKDISPLAKELIEKLKHLSDNSNENEEIKIINEKIKDLLTKLEEICIISEKISHSNKPDNSTSIYTLAEKLIEKLKHLSDNSNENEEIKIINEKIKDLREKVLSDLGTETNLNWNIQKDMKSLITLLKDKIPCIADIATSKFSFQSEGKGNPLLAVRFYKKDKESNCSNLEEENLPNFVKLEGEEFVMMIFRKNNENTSLLNEIIKALYVDEDGFNTMQIEEGVKGEIKKEIKNKIRELRKHYKFRKNLY